MTDISIQGSMNLYSTLPNQIIDLVTWWLVPLFLLFNIVGWAWLPQREVNRSNPRLSEQDLSDLGRALWAAWLVGAVAGLASLFSIFELFPASVKETIPITSQVTIAGAIGAILGIARGIMPRVKSFRKQAPLTQRRILAGVVLCAVAVSIASAVLYYDAALSLRTLIASAYTWMLVGLAATHVFDIGK
jgi:hypothetical protein